MKAKFTSGLFRFIIALAIVLAVAEAAKAQLPDCTNGNTVYAIFNRDDVSTVADSSEIRPVNTVTGAVGGLMGGKRWWIRKRRGTTSTYYYGSSGMGVDMITNRFYVITQMSAAIPKDIISIDPVGLGQVIIGTTPSSLDNYHFVKLAISPNGYGYALGVNRDTNSAASTYNPLIRFVTCGATPSLNCATSGSNAILTLGYMPSTGNMYKSKLFNGDIAFDTYGNLYFVTVAFDPVGSSLKYTDARLFRIDAADIPSVAGSGTINMTFVADYNSLDTTVVNGIALDASGNMLITSRIFDNNSTNPSGPWTPVIYTSPTPGTATLLGGFSSPTPNFNVADLASCYFPTTILGLNSLQLQYKYERGNVNLKWHAKSNPQTVRFEVQRSNTGNDDDFETIATVQPGQLDYYTYSDPQAGYDKHKFYRIRQVMSTNYRFYSNVVRVNFNNRFNLIGKLGPNPFNSMVEAKVWMRTANTVNVRILDQSGRTVYTRQFAGKIGDNRFTIDNLGHFKAGAYIVEIAVHEEVIREKIIKQ